jgi:Tfp pilus assembly protein FimT
MLIKLSTKWKIANRKSQRGIGLLELMLSLSIIAVLLVMATRYYLAARQEQQVNNAISMIHGIVAGTANWALGQQSGGYAGVSITELATGNFIPTSFNGSGNGGGADPWGGDLKVTSSSSNSYQVTMSNVPTAACNYLPNVINYNGDTGTTTCSNGLITATFN